MTERQGDMIVDRLAFSRRDYNPRGNLAAAMQYLQDNHATGVVEAVHVPVPRSRRKRLKDCVIRAVGRMLDPDEVD